MTQLAGVTKRIVGNGGYGQTATLFQWSPSNSTDDWDDPETYSKSTTDINVVPTDMGLTVQTGDVSSDEWAKYKEAEMALLTDYDGSITEIGEGDDVKPDEVKYDGETFVVLVDFEFEGARILGLVRERHDL